MEIIVTESQLNRILSEEKSNMISSVFNNSTSSLKRILRDVKRQYKLDFTYLVSYGAIIGGFMRPIEEYLHDSYPKLNQSEISLICFGLIMTFFASNEEKLKKTLKIIKDEGLVNIFNLALEKSYDLRDSFINFLDSLKLSLPKMTHALAYSFLIPLLPIITNVITQDDGRMDNVSMLVKAILTYTSLSISSMTLEEILKKIIKRFKS